MYLYLFNAPVTILFKSCLLLYYIKEWGNKPAKMKERYVITNSNSNLSIRLFFYQESSSVLRCATCHHFFLLSAVFFHVVFWVKKIILFLNLFFISKWSWFKVANARFFLQFSFKQSMKSLLIGQEPIFRYFFESSGLEVDWALA